MIMPKVSKKNYISDVTKHQPELLSKLLCQFVHDGMTVILNPLK